MDGKMIAAGLSATAPAYGLAAFIILLSMILQELNA
jgi:hypothetical protein